MRSFAAYAMGWLYVLVALMLVGSAICVPHSALYIHENNLLVEESGHGPLGRIVGAVPADEGRGFQVSVLRPLQA